MSSRVRETLEGEVTRVRTERCGGHVHLREHVFAGGRGAALASKPYLLQNSTTASASGGASDG